MFMDDSVIVFRYPIILFVVSFLVLWLSAHTGRLLARALHVRLTEHIEVLAVIQGATLTLLGLIIGFSFRWRSAATTSARTTRKRKPTRSARSICVPILAGRRLPRKCVPCCATISTFASSTTRRARMEQLDDINPSNRRHAKRNSGATIRGPVAAQPTTVLALVAAGMNDVLNSQGYTQAAWLNRIPAAAWALLSAIAICATMLLGLGAKKTVPSRIQPVLPLVISIAFFLIADIDSPRRGVIRVVPQNLISLAQSLRAP